MYMLTIPTKKITMAVKYVRNTENDIISFTEQNKGNIKFNRPSNTHIVSHGIEKTSCQLYWQSVVRLNKKK